MGQWHALHYFGLPTRCPAGTWADSELINGYLPIVPMGQWHVLPRIVPLSTNCPFWTILADTYHLKDYPNLMLLVAERPLVGSKRIIPRRVLSCPIGTVGGFVEAVIGLKFFTISKS